MNELDHLITGLTILREHVRKVGSDPENDCYVETWDDLTVMVWCIGSDDMSAARYSALENAGWFYTEDWYGPGYWKLSANE